MIAFSEIDIAYEGRKAGIEARRAGGHDPTAGERTAFARGYEDGLTAGEWVQRGGRWTLVGE